MDVDVDVCVCVWRELVGFRMGGRDVFCLLTDKWMYNASR